MSSRTVLVCLLFLYAATALCPEPLHFRKGEPVVIHIEKFHFKSDVKTVSRGATVEWINSDIVPHTATSLDKQAFDSGQIPAGGSWRVTLTQAGTFNYVCTLHPNMKGKLIVR